GLGGGGGEGGDAHREGSQRRQGRSDMPHGQKLHDLGTAKASSTGIPISASGNHAISSPVRRPAATRVRPPRRIPPTARPSGANCRISDAGKRSAAPSISSRLACPALPLETS